jgi:hypothetical protein
MSKIDLPTRICKRCGHGSDPEKPWILRKSKEPVVCPKCKSPYWRSKPKKKKQEKECTIWPKIKEYKPLKEKEAERSRKNEE